MKTDRSEFWVLFLLNLSGLLKATSVSPRGLIRNVRIDWDNSANQPIVSWPEGIKLVNTVSTRRRVSSDEEASEAVLASASVSSVESMATQQSVPGSVKPVLRITPKQRTYTWERDELIISCNMTALTNPACTRLIPPITWMSASGSKCKVTHTSATDPSADSVIEIAVARTLAEESLSTLRMAGFKREDIYRMLDKGPWALAFDMSKTLPRLLSDLEGDLYMTRAEAVHALSHCPFLIAQYARYKGRDVYSTVQALIEVGYAKATIISDIMRFPSMLAAPPDRLRGWLALLKGFGIAREPGLFGKLLKRAPFMFYINPPSIFASGPGDEGWPDVDGPSDSDRAGQTAVAGDASTFVSYQSLAVLQQLSSLSVKDLDKVVRTQPNILLCEPDEVARRSAFLLNLFLEPSYQLSLGAGAGTRVSVAAVAGQKRAPLSSAGAEPPASGFEGVGLSQVFTQRLERSIDVAPSLKEQSRREAQEKLSGLLQCYPSVLSLDFEKMRSAANALRRCGMRRADVVLLARRHPPLLARSAADLQALCQFLRADAGVRASELVPFLLKLPAILSADARDLNPKVEYLKRTMGGSTALLKRTPSYLSFDLDSHIRPRAEFLRAAGVDPLVYGLGHLLNAQPAELSATAGLQNVPDVYGQFKVAFADMWRKKVQREKAAGLVGLGLGSGLGLAETVVEGGAGPRVVSGSGGDGDGTVGGEGEDEEEEDESEFVTKCRRVFRRMVKSGTSVETLFSQIDLDGDGSLTVDELQVALAKSAFHELASGDVASLVKILDEDGDGEVDVQEFKQFVQNGLLGLIADVFDEDNNAF